MLSITGRNVNEVYRSALVHFRAEPTELIEATPRGQRRWQYPVPIASTYRNPQERVLFDDVRDANPFFHFMESLWIIAGRSDVHWLGQWLASIAEYSDDGRYFHGAYGFRLHHADQLARVVKRLREEPDTTRAVLQIYDRELDMHYRGKDMPCNCMIFLGKQAGRLNITVANRSNDMIWGAYGANVVQFSMLQEYLARLVDAKVGWYVQMSHNAHIYPDNEVTQRVLRETGLLLGDPYAEGLVYPYDMWQEATIDDWNRDLRTFMYNPDNPYKTAFFAQVVYPMYISHLYYRSKDYKGAIKVCEAELKASDWQLACINWLITRARNAGRKA